MDPAFAKIFKENEGKEEHSKGIRWESYSGYDVSDTATILSLRMDAADIKHILGESYIQSSSFNIVFTPTNYGCKLNVYIHKDDINSGMFLLVWALTLKMKKRIVWGGGYKKEFEDLYQKYKNIDKGEANAESPQNDGKQDSNQVIEKYWEAFNKEADIKKVFLWLTTDFTLGELEEKLFIGAGNGKRLSVDLSMLRSVKEFPSGKKEKQVFLKKWKSYLQQANDKEREKYQELTDRFLMNREQNK